MNTSKEGEPRGRGGGTHLQQRWRGWHLNAQVLAWPDPGQVAASAGSNTGGSAGRGRRHSRSKSWNHWYHGQCL